MNREQAEQINDHLLDAGAALEKAGRAIAGLGKAERLKFDEWLDAIIGMLEDELLQPIYDQHPDLEPPKNDREPVRYICELTWDEVQLPPSVTEEQFDEIILSVMKPTWRKTSMMVILVMDRCKELGLSIEGEMIGARLRMLSDSDRIEGIGDLRDWFRSEVRLKD